MKNYKFVFVVILTGALCTGVQAANIKEQIKEQASTPPGTTVLNGAPPAPAFHFVDPETGPSLGSVGSTRPAELSLARAASTLDKAPAQSFAGGTVAAAHASPGKTGLTSTQSAASKISEPATEVLLLVALSALAIAVRRQSPT